MAMQILQGNQFFNPHSKDWLKNKFKYYSEIRESDTMYFSQKYSSYIVTRFNDVKDALLDTKTFSSAKGNLIVENSYRFGRTLGASDEPTHSVYKDIVKHAYSKENIDRVVSDSLVDIDVSKNTLNISETAKLISAKLTAELLGLPVDKQTVINLILGIQRQSPEAVLFNTNTIHDIKFKSIIDYHLSNRTPATSHGIYSEMLDNNGTQIKSLLIGPCISGASSLTGALQFLILDLFREKHTPNDIAAAVDESIRFNSSTGRFARTIMQPTTIQNTILNPGDRVILCLDAANRDPRYFIKPDLFKENRLEKSLGFGYGVHSCIALAISKAIMVAFLHKLNYEFGKYIVVSEPEYLISASGNNDMLNNIIIEHET